jgi:hypothetical protein
MEQQEFIGQPTQQPMDKKRPTAITVVCVIGFIGAAITIPLIFSDVARQIGSWYPPYLGLSAVIGLICMIGLWNMKKWAAYTYTAFVLINQIILLVMGVWNIMALLIPAIVVTIAMTHLKKMD